MHPVWRPPRRPDPSTIRGTGAAERLRLASFHTELSARGPGLILRDILRVEDQIAATLDVILAADADILALQGVDYDAGGAALGALTAALSERGLDYPYHIAPRPNSGWPTGHDLDGDGRSDGPRDAHGFGYFNGEGGMALLSRYPLGEVVDHSRVIWADLPGNSAAGVTPTEALADLRLHSVGAWEVEVLTPSGPFHILSSHASAPVFDGPEDRNGLRNADEVRFWHLRLDEMAPDAGDFAYLGTLNVDPDQGEGRRDALAAFLAHPMVQDPVPVGHGDTATADWADPVPGDLRVDYVLPAATLIVLGSGVLWPEDGPLAEAVQEASDHPAGLGRHLFLKQWHDGNCQRLVQRRGLHRTNQIGQRPAIHAVRLIPQIPHFQKVLCFAPERSGQMNRQPTHGGRLHVAPDDTGQGIGKLPPGQAITLKRQVSERRKFVQTLRHLGKRLGQIGQVGPCMGTIQRAGIRDPALRDFGGDDAVEPIAGCLCI